MRGNEPQALGVSRVVPVREAGLAGVEVFRLERGEGFAVEPAAIPAGEVGKLDDEHGGFRIAQGGRAREQNVSEATGGHAVSYHEKGGQATFQRAGKGLKSRDQTSLSPFPARLRGPQALLI